MYVVTPRCAAAAVVSAVVLRRPTKEYTHPYMMHRRLPTAGIEVAPHYHQLLVNQCQLRRAEQSLHFASIPANFSIFYHSAAPTTHMCVYFSVATPATASTTAVAFHQHN